MSFDSLQLAEWCEGKWNTVPTRDLLGFCFDTRTLVAGDVFIALKTQKRDGHEFLNDAKHKGAVAALVSESRSDSELPQLVVADTLLAFQDIARNFRLTFGGTVVGITGSCGKTTTKDLVAALLGESAEVAKTSGNLNNLLGVPSTLLQVDAGRAKFAVIEAGISERGEMARLEEMIQPDVVAFTSIGASHLEGLRNVDTIAQEKVLLAMGKRAVRVYLSESCLPLKAFRDLAEARWVVPNESLDQEYQFLASSEGEETRLQIRIDGALELYSFAGVGKGLSSNVALAVSIARDSGVSQLQVQTRLQGWKLGGMRGEWMEIGDKRVFLDCYNANPLSMADALGTFYFLSEEGSPRLFIIGSMEELGGASRSLHEDLGRNLRLSPGDSVCLIGTHAECVATGARSSGIGRDVRIEVMESIDVIRERVGEFSGDVFIKGSRRYRLEEVLDGVAGPRAREDSVC